VTSTDVHLRRVLVNPPGFDVDHELVVIHNAGAEDVDLSGWSLSDTLNHPVAPFTFRFPTFTLIPDATVAVHTGGGADDGQNLFWGRADAVWNNKGDRAMLTDAQGSQIHLLAWNGPPPDGRVLDTRNLGIELGDAGPIADVAQPTSDVKFALGPDGGEIFWREYGATGAAFHQGFPDSQPAGAARPSDPIIAVQESTYLKYMELGGPRIMGRPLTRRTAVANTDGRQILRQDFEGGTIIRSQSTGAHLIRGAIRAKWLSPEVGGPTGRMGLPLTEEYADGTGPEKIVVSDFEHGSIWWTEAGGARVMFGIIVDFVGFHCFGDTGGLGSDEVYFSVEVVRRNPPLNAPTSVEDGMWYTMLPGSGEPVYEEVDPHDTVLDQTIVYVGRAVPLNINVNLWEQDVGDPAALKAKIKVAVQAAGAVTAAFVPAASAVALNPDVQATVADIISAAADPDDDFISRGQWIIGSRQRIRSLLEMPMGSEDGITCHGSIYLTDGDATYKAYFSVRSWDPDH
jgi:hypothetical protein